MVENSFSECSSEAEDDITMHSNIEEGSDVVYLNNASRAPLDVRVQEEGMKYMLQPPWKLHKTDKDQERIRQLFASLTGADQSQIAIMPSTAFAITVAAYNFERTILTERRSGRILILQDQMCSAVYPWQQVCENSNGDIKLDIVPYPSNEGGWTESILNKLNDDVLVACLPPLHWTDGALIDLDTVGVACRKHNTMLIVDATQAVGIIPCSVSKMQPTLLACSVHKWLRGPIGLSLVYVAPHVHKSWTPLDLHGRSRNMPGGRAWDASKNEIGPNGYPETFYDDARKFDGGGKPNPILLPMLRASLEQVILIDKQRAQEILKSLVMPLIKWAVANGYTLTPGPHSYHLIGIRPATYTPQQMIEISSSLQQQGIFIAVRCGAFRISPYLTNSTSDMQRLIKGLNAFASGT